MSDSPTYDATAIVVGKVVGQDLRHGVPVARREMRNVARGRLACRVFQPRCRLAELLEACECRVQVPIVEYFCAIDQFAVNRKNRGPAPLGVETLLRGPMCRISDDCSAFGQPVHGLDIDLAVLVPIRHGVDICDQVADPHRKLTSAVDVDTVRRGQRHLVSVDRRVAARDHRPGARVSGRFAGEVSGVKFGEGAVEVAEVENDDRRDLIVRVDFEDAQRIR